MTRRQGLASPGRLAHRVEAGDQPRTAFFRQQHPPRPADRHRRKLALLYSSAAMEGNVNKMIKRQMYGRASLPCSASASCSPPNQPAARKSRADGRRSLHYGLVTAVPELRNDGIILNAHTDSEVAAHVAGEDEETARRFGWWPASRRRRQSGPPTRTGQGTGRTTAR